MNIGIIGIGNIATTIINGLQEKIKDGSYKLYGYDHHPFKRLDDFDHKKMIIKTESIKELEENSDYIIIAVKPNGVKDVLEQLATNKVIISLAGGVDINQLERFTSENNKIVRVMPNVNGAVKESISGITKNDNVSEKQLKDVIEIFNNIGKTVVIPENQFDLFASIAGSFPAVIYLMIDSIANTAVKHGMNKQQANEIISQMILGSVKYAQVEAIDNNKNVRSLVDKVSSPGGTTIKGIMSLEETGFTNSIEKAVEAMIYKKGEKK